MHAPFWKNGSLKFWVPDRFQHRVPSGRPKPNAPPRALLNKTKVMSAAYEKGEIHFDKHHIMFFHDVAKETDKKRRAYDGVKTRYRDMGLRHGIQYPSSFRVTHDGNAHLFTSPTDVHTFLNKRERPRD
ncbi:hypothetical protein KUCAC02_011483 [Chaenocephalus aceratus]|uniref:Uncharacterized protein n=1 Tax=Chaenocephalus aceratus TaxID=36190 RepID=A0ACB9WXF2_CHAAC|nr:hypothetical protein KUCAC02_011483 [Chaenocephalus aceratus]